jgi:hypothetical protein
MLSPIPSVAYVTHEGKKRPGAWPDRSPIGSDRTCESTGSHGKCLARDRRFRRPVGAFDSACQAFRSAAVTRKGQRRLAGRPAPEKFVKAVVKKK